MKSPFCSFHPAPTSIRSCQKEADGRTWAPAKGSVRFLCPSWEMSQVQGTNTAALPDEAQSALAATWQGPGDLFLQLPCSCYGLCNRRGLSPPANLLLDVPHLRTCHVSCCKDSCGIQPSPSRSQSRYLPETRSTASTRRSPWQLSSHNCEAAMII